MSKILHPVLFARIRITNFNFMNFDDPQRAPMPRALVSCVACGEPSKMGFIFFSGEYFWEVVVGVHRQPHLIYTISEKYLQG